MLRRALLLVLLLGASTACRRTGGGAKAPACLNNATCGPGAYCVFEPGLCGRGPGNGVCRPRPTACARAMEPVCGCDGQVYTNACIAQVAGVDLAATGGCKEVEPGWAPCGARFCDARTSYCESHRSDVPEVPTTYACRPLPAACHPREAGAPPSCECFPRDTPCLAACAPSLTGGVQAFHLTCQGKKEPRR